jgi:hypothetical protein
MKHAIHKDADYLADRPGDSPALALAFAFPPPCRCLHELWRQRACLLIVQLRGLAALGSIQVSEIDRSVENRLAGLADAVGGMLVEIDGAEARRWAVGARRLARRNVPTTQASYIVTA